MFLVFFVKVFVKVNELLNLVCGDDEFKVLIDVVCVDLYELIDFDEKLIDIFFNVVISLFLINLCWMFDILKNIFDDNFFS